MYVIALYGKKLQIVLNKYCLAISKKDGWF